MGWAATAPAGCRVGRPRRSFWDGGRSADGWPETVVDLQPMAAYGGRSADIVSACRAGTAATVWLAATTVADVPPMHHRSRRSSG